MTVGGGLKWFSHYCRFNGTTVSVLRHEEGYTVKYSLSTREMPKAELRDFLSAQSLFHRISRLESLYRNSQFLKGIH